MLASVLFMRTIIVEVEIRQHSNMHITPHLILRAFFILHNTIHLSTLDNFAVDKKTETSSRCPTRSGTSNRCNDHFQVHKGQSSVPALCCVSEAENFSASTWLTEVNAALCHECSRNDNGYLHLNTVLATINSTKVHKV